MIVQCGSKHYTTELSWNAGSIDVKDVNMLMLFYHYVKLVSVNTCMKHVFLQEDEDGGKKYTSHMLEQLHLYTVD